MTKTTGIADARVIIIGGGIAGCSAAYHLAMLGVTDVLLLERAALSCGTTWHSSGNMETYRDDPLIFEMVRYAVQSFARLQVDGGRDIGWRNLGRVMYTDCAERLELFKTLPELGRTRGIEIQLLSPKEVGQRLAIIDPLGLAGGVWVPSDGRVNPTDVVTAYAQAARARGVRVLENVEVLEVTVRDGCVRGVVTEQGAIACDVVIIAAGLWSSKIAKSCGVSLPLHALEHQYIITKPIANLDRAMPLFLSYDDQLYGREEVGGLMVGSLDDDALPISVDDLPESFSFALLPERWEQFEPYMITAMRRFPVLRNADIKMQLNGPESFTPDGQMLLGPIPGLDGLYSACGFNSNGIALSPAAGKFIAEWIVEGAASADVTPLDVRRFAAIQTSDAYMRARVTEVPGFSCRIHGPGDDYKTARNIRHSPIHQELVAAGGNFGSVSGWERPLWFTGTQANGDWLVAVGAEVDAAANCGLIADRSSDTKIALSGPGVVAWTSAQVVLRPAQPQSCAATAAFPGARGEIEALGRILPCKDSVLLTVGPEQQTRLAEWLRRRRLPPGVTAVDVTNGWALFEVQGAKHLAALAASFSIDETVLSSAVNGAWWIGAVQIQAVTDPVQASVLVLAPADSAAYVWRRLMGAGESVGLRIVGHYAQECLRIARGVPRFGQEASLATSIAEIFGSDLKSRPDTLAPLPGARGILVPPRVFRAFASPGGLPGFGSREAIVHGDRTVGEATSRVWLPGWPQTQLLALVDPTSVSLSSLEVVADGRRWPLVPRRTEWQSTGSATQR